MSVNITVNGKFNKHCRSHTLLDDPQNVRKAEEQERRKLRLLQVREQSKKFAKKIRDRVNEQKKRQLEELQATKQKEYECWRQQASERGGKEYLSAIFQISTAPIVTRKEIIEKQKQQETYKNFKKRMAERKAKQGNDQFSCQKPCPCQQPSANKEFKCACTQTDDLNINTNEEPHKRKRDSSFSSSESECEDEGYKEQTLFAQSSSSLSTSCDSSTSFSNNRATQTSMFVPKKNKCLVKTPAVCLDVEVGTDDSVTISAPAEIKDRHSEYNRQFSSVIRVSPRKSRKEVDDIVAKPSLQQTSTTTTQSSDITVKKPDENDAEKSETKGLTNAGPSKEKRFTLISELVKKQQEKEFQPTYNSQGKCVTLCPTVHASTTSVTSHLSPRKQIKDVTVKPSLNIYKPQSPRKASATSRSSRTVTDNTQPATSLTTTLKSNTDVVSGTSSSGRVQFYDYNSKLSKERDQSATMISVQRQRDQTQPTAMQQAEFENQREREKQRETLKKCQQTEQRGQKALEREQIRRDCNELTEKLEALTREYPNQIPTNEIQTHLFMDKQLRKEGKMNAAVEKLLNRPTIITCSELNKPVQEDNKAYKGTPTMSVLGNEINVGITNKNPMPADDVSSDSCCSILLGYVNDQSRLIRQDLQNSDTDGTNQDKSKEKRLKDLLKRLDQLRNSLVQELKNESEFKQSSKPEDKSAFSTKERKLRQVVDSISELRKEREEILINEINKKTKPLKEREKELQTKEAILEQKVREFFDLQKQQRKPKNVESESNGGSSSSTDKTVELEKKSNNKENIVCTSGKNPLEIIITVKGDNKCVKQKRKVTLKKSPCKVSTLIKTHQPKLPAGKRSTPKKKTQPFKQLDKGILHRQNSYDSNSTSYMSLPPELKTKLDDLAERIAQEKQNQPINVHSINKRKSIQTAESSSKISSTQDKQCDSEISLEPLYDADSFNMPPRINPLIAQYVQRLLGMSRNAVQKLGVSSSDIETPASTIINTTGNVTTTDTISDEYFISMNNFIEENISFIKDLEQSMESQNNASLENSMKMFDDIWRKRLKSYSMGNIKNKKSQNRSAADEKSKEKPKNKITKKESKPSLIPRECNEVIADNIEKSSNDDKEQQPTSNLISNTKKMSDKISSSHYSTDDKETPKPLKSFNRSVEKADKAIDTKHSIDSNKSEPDSQIARYAKLTENCTQRIAELTELINRVREEKQRLLEVTLSSVSDNGRQSTEYLDLPLDKANTRNHQDDLTRVSSSSEELTKNKQSQSSETLSEMPKLLSTDKNKQITASCDSGIAESRPLTAQEVRNEQDPISHTSSENIIPPLNRKMKPPPTLKRFSPQLPEDELAHELSTILEVDTPATSRITTAVGHTKDEQEHVADNGQQQIVKFPTFEQYIKQYNLDITQLDPEQSIQLQQEFTTFMEYLQHNKSLADHPQYKEFPNLNAYFTEGDHHNDDTMEESLTQLRINGIHPRGFPVFREYVKRNASKSTPDEPQLLDTESLENITEEPTHTNTETENASIDIEEELKKRKILKHSFRYIEQKKQQRDTAFYAEIIAGESGMEKLSTSGNTTEMLENDLKLMIEEWPKELKTKSQRSKQILSSTTTSANASTLANSALRAASEDSSRHNGQALNLREFLTRELLKHANISSSTSSISSDDSLRSRFLHSLIGSLTPRTTGAGSKSGTQTLDRQKTSTPVPMQSSQAHSSTSSQSNTSNQLFSGESHLSSVPYQDRQVRFLYNNDANVNQSSG